MTRVSGVNRTNEHRSLTYGVGQTSLIAMTSCETWVGTCRNLLGDIGIGGVAQLAPLGVGPLETLDQAVVVKHLGLLLLWQLLHDIEDGGQDSAAARGRRGVESETAPGGATCWKVTL